VAEEGGREEAFSVGRVLGVIKRRNPQLYEEVVSIAKSEGAKATDIIEDALELYVRYKRLEGIDVRSLLVAFNLIRDVMDMVMGMMMTVEKYFTSEFFKQQVEILSELKRREAESAASGGKGEVSTIRRRVMEELAPKLVSTIFNIVMNMLASMARSMQAGTQAQQTQPVATSSITEETPFKGVKIVESSKKKK